SRRRDRSLGWKPVRGAAATDGFRKPRRPEPRRRAQESDQRATEELIDCACIADISPPPPRTCATTPAAEARPQPASQPSPPRNPIRNAGANAIRSPPTKA